MIRTTIEDIRIAYTGSANDISFNPDFLGYEELTVGDGNVLVDASAVSANVLIRVGNGNHAVVTGSGDDLVVLGTGVSVVNTGDGSDS
jgi:hypothetical protein